ncbi:MAG: proton-conducting transporter membrane subunit [Candidatus Omnitrophica bacterium]|nr:proton-conducting transporter membrane subunit [Candidatus Omnitrophota bacterium]
MTTFFPQQLFYLDPLAIFFLAVIGLVSLPSAVFSVGYLRSESPARRALAWVLFLAFALSMCLVVVSGNLFSFLVFWELMSLFSYFLVVFDHTHEKSVRAGTVYFVMTHIGTALIMAAFLILYAQAGSFDFTAVKQAASAMPGSARNIVFLLLFLGFAAKAGVAPLHIWLPLAHPQAPSHISSMMSGVMIKIAVYGMARFFILCLGTGPAWWGGCILAFAVVSCLIGVIYALMDHDLKRLLAYHSVENIGIILLGVGAAMFFTSKGMPAEAALALCAGLYHLINHALFKALLFLCSGSVVKATGIRDMEKMGGLIKVMPWTAGFFLVGAMGISALPPLNGFVSEWLMFQSFFAGIINSFGGVKLYMVLCAAALALTSGLAAACFVKAFGITFLALPRSRRAQDAHEVSLSMKLGMGFLAAMVVLFGVGAGVVFPLIMRVAQETLGIPGGPVALPTRLLAVAPVGQASISPFLMTAVLGLTALAAFIWFRFVSRRKKSTYNTWDCGYYDLDSRNEYTATAFSKKFRFAFSFFLLPYRKVDKIRESFYHVRSFTYETHTTAVFEKHIYKPLLGLIYGMALRMRKLQPGSINLYILYIFLALVILIGITGVLNP